MRASIILTILSMTLPEQLGATATPTPFSTLLARQVKRGFKKYKGTNKCKWSVSISLVIFNCYLP